MDVIVLTEAARRRFRHFCSLIDSGQYGSQFYYMVMTLVGQSLHDLRKVSKWSGRDDFGQSWDKAKFDHHSLPVFQARPAPDDHFSVRTAIQIGIQALEAIEELHSIGYVHRLGVFSYSEQNPQPRTQHMPTPSFRDIKPGNFSVGLAERNEQHKIFILDFGMCRKFTHDDGTLRRPRERVDFRGTPRYAPLNCHLKREYTRADDVESLVGNGCA